MNDNITGRTLTVLLVILLVVGPGPGEARDFPETTSHIEQEASYNSGDCLVTDFGAVCDGTTDDTAAIQKALDTCATTHSIVSLPAAGRAMNSSNRTCVSFPLDFPNGTQLFIPAGATLKASTNIHLWPNDTMYNFVELKRKRNIIVFGQGTIDGSGPAWWPLLSNAVDHSANDGESPNINATRTNKLTKSSGTLLTPSPSPINLPRLFHMEIIENVSFIGVTLKNSPAMTLGFGSPCRNIVVDSVTIDNYAVGNTDGIDVGCDGALIQHSIVRNGDDSICMKSQASNVLVHNCTVHNGKPYQPVHIETSLSLQDTVGGNKGPEQLLHTNDSQLTGSTPIQNAAHGLAGGLVLGTSVNNTMQNITFRNCSVTEALAGIRFKFRSSQTGFVDGVLFEDIRIVRPVAYAIDMLLDSDHYNAGGGSDSGHEDYGHSSLSPKMLSTTSVNNVTIRNVVGELEPIPSSICNGGAVCPRAVGRFRCTAALPCANVTLENVSVTGFNASSAYPTPCEFQFVTGTGQNVTPNQCVLPTASAA